MINCELYISALISARYSVLFEERLSWNDLKHDVPHAFNRPGLIKLLHPLYNNILIKYSRKRATYGVNVSLHKYLELYVYS